MIEVVDVADVVDALITTIVQLPATTGILTVEPSYRTTVGVLADIASRFGRGGRPDPARPMEIALFAAFESYAKQFNAARPLHTP